VKKTITISMTSTRGWEKGMFVHVDDESFIVDRVMSSSLAIHKPGWFERRWRAFANRTKARWRRLRDPRRW
jgi:hypothetical protein